MADDYQEKRAALEEAKKRVEAIIPTLPDGLQKELLRTNWRNVVIVNVPEGTSIPASMLGVSPTINGRMWPHTAEIGPALNAYHAAYKAARIAHNRLTGLGQTADPPEP